MSEINDIIARDPLSSQSSQDFVESVMATPRPKVVELDCDNCYNKTDDDGTRIDVGESDHDIIFTRADIHKCGDSRKRRIAENEHSNSETKRSRALINNVEEPSMHDEQNIESMYPRNSPTDMQELKCLVLDISRKFHERCDELESNIIIKIVEMTDAKIKHEIDKVKNEMGRMVNGEVGKVRKDFTKNLKEVNDSLTSKISKIEQNIPPKSNDGIDNPTDRSRNIIIRNLEQSPQENGHDGDTVTKERVQALIRDGLKLNNISVDHAIRRTNLNKGPGIIIATLTTRDDKNTILKNKASLKYTKDYKRVYIDLDRAKYEMELQRSLQTIVKELGKENTYRIHGTRIVRKDSGNQRREYSGKWPENVRENSRHSSRNDNAWGRYGKSRTDFNDRSEWREVNRDRRANSSRHRNSNNA